MKLVRILLAGLLLTAASAGCGGSTADFVKTDAYFAPAEAAALPSIFLDRRPSEPYQSVGIIYVRAPANAELGLITGTAAEKGREIGCDVIVDRQIHSVSSALPLDLPRYGVVIEESLRGEGRPTDPAHPADPGDRSFLGQVFVPAPQPVITQTQPTYYPTRSTVIVEAPPTTREFVCGIYLRGSRTRVAPAPGGKGAPSGPASYMARNSSLRVPLDSERTATSAPPKGAGGFSFGASPAASEQTCTGVKHRFQPAGEAIWACDGVAADVGLPAQSVLRFCNGALCAIEVIGKPKGVKKAQWLPQFESLRDALTGKYGPHSYTSGQVPPDCLADENACRISAIHAHSVGWAWKSGEQIELTIEVTARVTEETRAYSALLSIDFLERPLPPPAAPAPPGPQKTPSGQAPAGL